MLLILVNIENLQKNQMLKGKSEDSKILKKSRVFWPLACLDMLVYFSLGYTHTRGGNIKLRRLKILNSI